MIIAFMTHTAEPDAEHGLHLNGGTDAPSAQSSIRLLGLDFDAITPAEALSLIAALVHGYAGNQVKSEAWGR